MHKSLGRDNATLRRIEIELRQFNSLIIYSNYEMRKINQEATREEKEKLLRDLPKPPRGYCYAYLRQEGGLYIVRKEEVDGKYVPIGGVRHRSLMKQEETLNRGRNIFRAQMHAGIRRK